MSHGASASRRRRVCQPAATAGLGRSAVYWRSDGRTVGPTLQLLAGLLLLPVNLRPAAVSVGPVLDEVRDGLACRRATAGLLTSLPVLAFAGFGALAPAAARRVGRAPGHPASHSWRVVVGLAAAPWRRTGAFLVLSLVALAGMADRERAAAVAGQAALPRPDRAAHRALHDGPGPRAHRALDAHGPDRGRSAVAGACGLGAWAVLAAVAALPWLRLVRHDRHLDPAPRDVSLSRRRPHPARAGHGPVLRAAVAACLRVFGWFAQLWRDAGLLRRHGRAPGRPRRGHPASRSRCGSRRPRPAATTSLVLLAVMACYPVGYVGLMLAPHALAVVWAVVVGAGDLHVPAGADPHRAAVTHAAPGTAALSGFTQSAGYLMSALGPFGVGALYDATGGWTRRCGS